MRKLSFSEAINAALSHAMQRDPSVFIMGIGVDDHKAIFGSTQRLVARFGAERVFDTPISEGAMTGVAIGAALGGLKPIHVHIRADFLYLAMDQLLNNAAKWRSMVGGRMSIPLVVRAVIGRSWGQGAQHSQSLQSQFMHVPGIKVAMPTTPADAQGLLLAAIADPNPVVLFEHRLLYGTIGEVPDPPAAVPFGRAVVRRQGSDLTIVANSHMALESLKAAELLQRCGVSAEVIDPVTLVPLDEDTIVQSIVKTGRLLVVDTSWITCGTSAEIAALAAEKAFAFLTGPVRRIGMRPGVCPVSKPLENAFYPCANTIVSEALAMLGRSSTETPAPERAAADLDETAGGIFSPTTADFKGPF